MHGEHDEAALIDFVLRCVDSRVAGDGIGKHVLLPLDERSQDVVQTSLDQPAHHEQTALELVELFHQAARRLSHRDCGRGNPATGLCRW